MFPERLTKGYRSFLGGRFTSERARYQDLAASGQSPSIMVIGCVDSRVSPEVIFDAAPGELLVARNVANLVPRYEPPTTPDRSLSSRSVSFEPNSVPVVPSWALKDVYVSSLLRSLLY